MTVFKHALNHDVNGRLGGGPAPASGQAMASALRGHLRSIQRSPGHVSNFFRHPEVAYDAG